jgi:hypothetical protein
MEQPVVYLMRGLPSCGKSFTARKLAGATGAVFETDEYFYLHVGDDTTKYDFRAELLPTARKWNFNRFVQAIKARVSPIVVDRGNGLNAETQQYARYAIQAGYRVELKEPESEWWQEIRVLLKYKELNGPILNQWAEKLQAINGSTHRTSASTIRRWMDRWQHDLTVEDILNYARPTGRNDASD